MDYDYALERWHNFRTLKEGQYPFIAGIPFSERKAAFDEHLCHTIGRAGELLYDVELEGYVRSGLQRSETEFDYYGGFNYITVELYQEVQEGRFQKIFETKTVPGPEGDGYYHFKFLDNEINYQIRYDTCSATLIKDWADYPARGTEELFITSTTFFARLDVTLPLYRLPAFQDTHVFFDKNRNGIWNSGERVFNNVPVVVHVLRDGKLYESYHDSTRSHGSVIVNARASCFDLEHYVHFNRNLLPPGYTLSTPALRPIGQDIGIIPAR